MISWVVCIVALVGWIIWRVAGPKDPQLGETGRLLFFCGLLVTCLLLAGRMARLL